ncbi:hypothetical protein DE146DRAFT_387448 [Phaeosphaeria sp. MPI-PUGE-AT-0046c]|nr:hypothetical protein DE146DRAFT_387448 [Phaeosphaeria sp. MPI-PUGE-AT-0046c]
MLIISRTRAYRMKLKEWGLMRHKPRRAGGKKHDRKESSASPRQGEEEQSEEDSDAAIEPIPIDLTSSESTPLATQADQLSSYHSQRQDHCDEHGRWRLVSDAELPETLPTFMGLLSQPANLEPTVDPWSAAPTQATDAVMAMLGAILNNECMLLEKLVMEHGDHINDPVGMPFESPASRFFGHPAMNQMVIGQHPGQTLLDIACGMPCGPVIWVLLSFGAKGSRHPLGTDLALHNAIKNGRPHTVQCLLRPGRSDINGIPGTTWKPLLQAVFWNQPEIVSILTRKGARLEDAGLSPRGSGYQTALQLCLDRRAAEYSQDLVRDKCNQILAHLLEAGADIHVAPPAGSTATAFETFIQPWQITPFWASKLTVLEIECFRKFVISGANIQTTFEGCPCGSLQQQSFEHQILWHSTPDLARLVVDSIPTNAFVNGSGLLHEVLGSCQHAKRHPADTLRDIEVLLQRGADPNQRDANGVTPLRKCIEQCPAVDLVARLQLLVDRGADPEDEDRDGVQPFVLAARTLQEPLLSEIMQILVGRMRGRYRRVIDGVARVWSAAHFPISDDQSYQQVMSSGRSTGDFRLEVQEMVPEDIRETFTRAHFAVVSKNFLDTMTRVAKARMLTSRDKEEIGWITGMRQGIDLPHYRFDQEVIVALLDPQPMMEISSESFDPARIAANDEEQTQNAVTQIERPNSAVAGIETTASPPPPRAQWQFNPNSSATPPPRPRSRTGSQSPSFIMPSTTIIRWHDPEGPVKPGDFEKACNSVLQYKCETCNDGVPLTKKEQERHGVEHAHTNSCKEEYCARRFCALKMRGNVSVGCQDHLFAGIV